MSNIASILINALTDKLTNYERTELLTGFGDLESASREIAVTRNIIVMGSIVLGTQDGITITHPSGARSIVLEPTGSAYFGKDVDQPAYTSLAVFSEPKIYNSETMGAGDVLLGDNSAGKANLLWDVSTGRLNFRGGKNTYVYIDTDGSIVAEQGRIGGWWIGATEIYSSGGGGYIELNSSASKIIVGANALVLDGAAETLTVGSGAPTIIIDGGSKVIKSSNYSAGAAGFNLSAVDSDAEFNNIVARGTFRASVFEIGTKTAVGGHVVLSKNAAEVWEDVTTPGSGSFTLKIKDTVTDVPIAAVNDVLSIQDWNGTELIDVWVTVTAVSNQSGYTSYTVDLESGASKDLQKGMAAVNYGPSGAGVLHLMAGETSTRLKIATHAGAPWTTMTNKVVLGNMRNTYGTGANDRYGIGIGDYSAHNYMSYNAETADKFIVRAAGGAITLSGDGLKARTAYGGAVTIKLDTDGDAFFGSNLAAPATTSFVVFANAQTYNTEAMGAGDVLLGDNSANKANLLWDKSDGDLKFRSGQTSNVKINTAGELDANTVKLGGTYGIEFYGSTGDFREVRWRYFDDPDYRNLGRVYGDYGGSGDGIMWVRSDKASGDPWDSPGVILMALDSDAGKDVRVWVDGSGLISLSGADVSVPDGDIYTTAWTNYFGSSTIVGWSSYTTSNLYVKKVGNLVYVNFNISGVSDLATTTFTLADTGATGSMISKPIRVRNSGTFQITPGYLKFAGSTVTLYLNMNSGAFANTGTKTIQGSFVYEAA